MNTVSILNVMLTTLMLVLIPLVLAFLFQKADEELNIKLNKKDIIIIAIVGIITSILLNIQYEKFMLYHTSFIMAYLIFMSYTDQKTKLVYNFCSEVVIVLEIALILLNDTNINILTTSVMILPLVMLVISLLGGLGIGDVCIYTALALYSITSKEFPFFSLTYIIILANIMFIIVGIIYKIATRNKDRKLPLTIYIAISFFICSILRI